MTRSIDNALFISPPPEEVSPLLDDLLEYVNDDSEHPIAQSAVVHARFEHIHPFPDGNGRTGRALVHLVWARRGVVSESGAIPVSAYLAQNRDMYIETLAASNASICSGEHNPDQAWAPVVDLFAAAGEHGCGLAAMFRVNARAALDQWKSEISARRGSLEAQILDDLPRHPVIHADMVSERYGKSLRRSQAALTKLEAADVIQSRSLKRGQRGYEAGRLLSIYSAGLSDRPMQLMTCANGDALEIAADRLESEKQAAASAGPVLCGAKTGNRRRCKRKLGPGRVCPYHGRR